MPALLHQSEYVVALRSIPDFAEAFLALARADDKKAQVAAAVARKALDALSKQYQAQVSKYWDDASTEALRLLVAVMANNPHKSKNEILKRPDIQGVLRQPFLEAAAKSEDALKQAWDEAEQLSVKHTKAEFKMLGEPWQGHTLDPSLQASLIKDLHDNAKAMRARFSEALNSDSVSQRLQGVANDGSRRARYSVQHAVWGAATQVRESAVAAAGLNKVWIAVLDSATCSHCAALHGTVLGPGEEYPANAGDTPLKVYRNTLLGPPRHPNCRCVLVPTKLQKSKS